MTIGELKKLIENVADDFEIDIIGEHSGSFGTILRIDIRTESFPDKEVQFFINA